MLDKIIGVFLITIVTFGIAMFGYIAYVLLTFVPPVENDGQNLLRCVTEFQGCTRLNDSYANIVICRKAANACRGNLMAKDDLKLF